MGDQAQLRGLAGAAGWAGVCSGLQQSPSSSSKHRGGSTEPGTVCKLLRDVGAQVDAAAGVVARSEPVPGRCFPALVVLTLLHPMHFLKTT